MSRYKIDPYLFSDQEKMVLKSLLSVNTPLKISRQLDLPRSTVYFILEKLKTRGLVKNERKGKKLFWSLRKDDNDEITTDSANKNNSVKIYDDDKLIDEFLEKITSASGSRLKIYSGDNIIDGWKRNVGVEKIIKFNQQLKENNLVSDWVASAVPLDEQIKAFGKNWLESFVQKPTEAHLIDTVYMRHGAQIFLKNDKVFLANFDKPIVIEIKNPEIAKMFSTIIDFFKDHTKKINLSEQI